MKLEADWQRINPEPDPIYGRPLARSSHGLSVIRSPDEHGNVLTRIYLYGGEHDARVPMDHFQTTWCAEPQSTSTGETVSWKWRCIVIPCSNKDDDEDEHHANKALPPLRVAHSQCSVGSKIYVFGGRCGKSMGESSFHDLWELDCSIPGMESWKEIQYSNCVPPEPRSYHQMVAAPDNCLYVFGGCGADGRLADLHRFNILDSSWSTLSSATHLPSCLAGRGGANLLVLGQRKIAIIAGFVGNESADGRVFDIQSCTWDTHHAITFPDMQPRSVCSFASGLRVKRSDSNESIDSDFAVIFGGEIDPSEKGHAGAGSFENDIWIVDGNSHTLVQRMTPQSLIQGNGADWPIQRGWASAASIDGSAQLYLFGGLSGDDENPVRLDDLWICTFK